MLVVFFFKKNVRILCRSAGKQFKKNVVYSEGDPFNSSPPNYPSQLQLESAGGKKVKIATASDQLSFYFILYRAKTLF